MDLIVLESLALKLVIVGLAFAALWWFTSWWWRSVGHKSARNHLNIIEADPKALALLRVGTLLALALLLGLAVGCAQAASIPSTYDKPIKAAAERYWPGVDWRWWRAQLYQESRLDPNARSPAGAIGLAQFMGPTWADVSRAMGWGLVDRRAAEPAITGGAFYMAQMRRFFRDADSATDQHELAQGGYNAGAGSIRKALRICDDGVTWAACVACLPQITGKNARETINYIPAIRKWFLLFI